jgi:hypothetical protein
MHRVSARAVIASVSVLRAVVSEYNAHPGGTHLIVYWRVYRDKRGVVVLRFCQRPCLCVLYRTLTPIVLARSGKRAPRGEPIPVHLWQSWHLASAPESHCPRA